MNVTVILCTYNRCDSLIKALESVAASAVPESVHWEVLVVDNNSSDRTRELVLEFCRTHPNHFRYLYEPEPGKSHALNTGIREAKGDILAFTDDDVVVEPNWLRNLTASLHESNFAGTAGRILAEKAFLPPNWIPTHETDALAPLAVFDPAIEPGPLKGSPFGANMAYHRRVFEKHGGFRTDLGPRLGGRLQKSEDTEFGQRLQAAGEQLCYEPSALVYHSVSTQRVRPRYFVRWWFDKSRSDVAAFGIPPEYKRFVLGVPLLPCRRILLWTLRWMLAVDPARRFSFKVKVWWLAGTILECHRMGRGGVANVQKDKVEISKNG